MSVKKPPLGLIPIQLHEQNVINMRVSEILAAMRRYAEAEIAVPVYWVNELEDKVWKIKT